MNIEEKLNQYEEEWTTQCVSTPHGSLRVSDRTIANNVPKLVRCLRIALAHFRNAGDTRVIAQLDDILGTE